MADKKTDKTYNAKQFAGRMGNMKKKFNDGAANVSAEAFQQLPDGTYTAQIHAATFKETSNGNLMVRIPFTVTEGELEKRRGDCTAFIDDKACFNEGDLAGVPFGMVDVTRNAKNLGIATVDDDGSARDFGDILEELEEVCAAEPIVTVICSSRTYTPTKGPNAGKERTNHQAKISGLVAAGDGGGDDNDDADVDADADDDSGDDESPAFAVGDEVKMKIGRVTHVCKVLKVNSDGTYNLKGADKKVHSKIEEDKLTAA
mgnify:CR=1 FL=1